jgi:hypothetical protein
MMQVSIDLGQSPLDSGFRRNDGYNKASRLPAPAFEMGTVLFYSSFRRKPESSR